MLPGTFESLHGPISGVTLDGYAAVLLARTRGGGLHAGMMFKVEDDGPLDVVHLGREDCLIQGWTFETGLWVVPIGADGDQLEVVAGLCRRVLKLFKHTGRFPYALAFRGTSIAPNGALILGEGSRGLTCATLLLALLLGAGVSLLDEASWPARSEDDRLFVNSLSMSAEHRNLLLAEIDAGVTRIRPHEVVGACRVLPTPAGYEAVVPHAEAASAAV